MEFGTQKSYGSFREWLGDLGYLIKNRRAVRAMMKGGLDPKFRERLMLAVTEVNQCRLCSYVHTRMALSQGLEKAEINRILSGHFQEAPEDELQALAYAQHWAETGGNPNPGVRQTFEAAYAPETVANIGLALRLIRTGNYTFNTMDGLLHRLTFGRLGVAREQRMKPN